MTDYRFFLRCELAINYCCTLLNKKVRLSGLNPESLTFSNMVRENILVPIQKLDKNKNTSEENPPEVLILVVVRETGIEPARRKALDPKSSASASSATPA